MKKKKFAARICACLLAASLSVADTLPSFAASVWQESAGDKQQTEEAADENIRFAEDMETAAEPEEIQPESEGGISDIPEADLKQTNETGTEISSEPETASEPGTEAGQETASGLQVSSDGQVYLDGVLYNGYYLDSAGILYLAANGVPAVKTGTVSAGTAYYSMPENGMKTFAAQTVFVGGKIYTGYYLDVDGILYTVTGGAAEVKTGTVDARSTYYSMPENGMITLPARTVYVAGKVYTGYYLDADGILYTVTGGVPEPETRIMSAGTAYYSIPDNGMATLPKETVYVDGNVYTGNYLNSKQKMYSVKKGTPTLKTGILKKGSKYYSYKDKKKQKLSKETLYVKGKAYTGNYLNSKQKMYSVKKGTRTLKTGILKKGSKYYSYSAGKTRKLSKETLYVKGKTYTGYYLNSKNRMYTAKKGTCTLETGILKAGTQYYGYKAGKNQKLSKDTLYVDGKVYTGYYQDSGNLMYSVNKGTCSPVTATLNAGTGYYSQNAKKIQTLSATTVYINGKAMEGMSPESLETLLRAQAVVAGITNDSMTKEQKLRVCFDYVKEAYLEIKPRIPHYLGMDWPVIYANDMFVNGAGNCCSYAAAFAYMAKAIGYDEVYCCNSGGHGWAEIDGLIYDPEWSKWHHVYNYFALSYDTPTDQGYKGAIGAGKPWMRVKI